MFSSLHIGRLFGIDVFVHPTFWLLPLFVFLSSSASLGAGHAVLDVAVVFAVFGCVALHEFGHALAAMHYGIRTRDITLYPIGGVARLENMPERPWPEIVVALAGPAVNVVIAAGVAGLMALDGYTILGGLRGGLSLEAFWARLLVANIVLVAFNLLPAFPMDGGRVFRAVVSWFTDRLTATEVAATVGAGIALLLGLIGLWQSEFMLVILAGFVFLAGRGELAALRHQEEVRRAERRWRQRSGGVPVAFPVDDSPVVHPVEPVPVNGWEFDPVSRTWTEWRDGFPVRRVQA
ncbi:MAG TPA: M50 family metallopeptidase [Fimbriiglobus sp.]|nr:M50 family metallopeptidase [Fimbriiglobus sp.]